MSDNFRIKGNWGQVCVLQAGFDVFDKSGQLINSKMWDSRSYTRNFARLVRSMFQFTAPSLTDINSSSFSGLMVSDPSNNGAKLIPRTTIATTTPTSLGINYTGAMLAIGTGALTGEDSAFVNLKSILGSPQDARLSTATLTEDANTIEFQIAEGITVTNTSGATITEIGLFARIREASGSGIGVNPRTVLIAYDEVNPGIFVPNGGVIAPKYILSFPA